MSGKASGSGLGPLCMLDAISLSERYRRKEVSPVEVASLALMRAEETAETLNAFCFIDREQVLAEAAASEQRWRDSKPLSRLDGIPCSVKDNIEVRGMPTRFGSRSFEGAAAASADSPPVARIREAGGVILGKTTLPELAHKLVTDSPLTGVTRNPWDLKLSPGGSSGGASAAVAAGIGPLALGTDGAGSVRMPASWTGIFALKPTFGRVPQHPRGAFASLSHVGPMTRTVADAALMMTVLSRPDYRDWYALPSEGKQYEDDLQAPLEGLRVACSATLGLKGIRLHPDVEAAFQAARNSLESLGAQIFDVDPPAIEEICAAQTVMWACFSARVMSRLPKPELVDPSLVKLAARGAEFTSNEFLEATISRGELGTRMNQFFTEYDLVLCPVYQSTPPLIDEDPGEPLMTMWCNQMAVPAASVPIELGATGLPMSVQIVGKRFADAQVLRVAAALERRHGLLRPPAFR